MNTLVMERHEVAEAHVREMFCHIVCCNAIITLCGAYKPKPSLCGYFALDQLGKGICPRCNREICPECLKLLFKPCQFCEAG